MNNSKIPHFKRTHCRIGNVGSTLTALQWKGNYNVLPRTNIDWKYCDENNKKCPTRMSQFVSNELSSSTIIYMLRSYYLYPIPNVKNQDYENSLRPVQIALFQRDRF